MSTHWLGASPALGKLPRLSVPLAKALRLLSSHLHGSAFWQVQAMVGVLTLFHYGAEVLAHGSTHFEYLDYIEPTFYAFPIVYSSLHFRRKGVILTSLWCELLTLPQAILWHQRPWEWVFELGQVAVGVTLGLMFSRMVEHQATERRRAEEMSTRLVALLRRVANGQEEEWRRIARELHDDTAQNLILLCQGLDRLAASSHPSQDSLSLLQELRTITEKVLADIRRFSRDLRPSILEDLGLLAAVKWLTAESSKRQGIDARVEVIGPPRPLPPETELSLFRIVQEALHNVERHAEATRLTVGLIFEDGFFRLSVRDNGKGFDPPDLNRLAFCDKLGLVGMQERAHLVGGILDIQTQIGQGTCASVTISG